MNLIPEHPGDTPNYWCSWGTQNSTLASSGDGKIEFTGDQGAQNARANLNESVVFGPNGWIDDFNGIQGDLFFVFDDGWDVPYGINPDRNLPQFGSVIPDAERFPSCQGSPAQRLKRLNEMAVSRGWRGVGLWIAAQARGDVADGPQMAAPALRRYWEERLEWSHEAGIRFWKVDWGVRSNDLTFRRMLTELGHRIAPEIMIEHSVGSPPLNAVVLSPQAAECSGSGRFSEIGGDIPRRAARLLQFSGMTRFYDLLSPLSTATAIDRLAFYLACAGEGFLNVEDEVYLGAATGCCFGVMRSPRHGKIRDSVSQAHRRIQEVYRAARWQRIAPAFPVGGETICTAPEVLEDEWRFPPDSTWMAAAFGKNVRQSAPAVLSRGMPLPRVTAVRDELPFVVASRHPNGAVAVGILPRLSNSRGFIRRRPGLRLNRTVPGAISGFSGISIRSRSRSRPAAGGCSVRTSPERKRWI